MSANSVTLHDGSPWLWVLLALAVLVVIFFGGYRESVSSWTAVGEGPPIVIKQSELESMAKAQAGEVVVYYSDAAMESVATQIAEELAHAYAFIAERLGWKPYPAGLVLIGGERPGAVRVEGEGELGMTFGLWLPTETIAEGLTQASEDVLDMIYWVMPHEGTEPLFSQKLYHDCGTRWVGDGLAEYAAYIVSGQFHPDVQQARLKGRLRTIERLLEQGKKSYNLPQEFQAFRSVQIVFLRLGCAKSPHEVMVAGYAVALAIWLDLVDKYGEELVRRFWQELQKLSRPTNQDVFRILGTLTGEDIKVKITQVDLQYAAEVLKKHLTSN